MPFRLFPLFRSSLPASHDGLTQPQREAIADLLHFCMYADNHLALAEQQMLDEAVQTLAWDPAVSFEAFEAGSIARARAAREDVNRAQVLLTDIGDRLNTPQARSLAFGLVNRLFAADGTRATSEAALHAQLRHLLA